LNLRYKFCLLLCLLSMVGLSWASTPALAFYYGANPPWSELQAFDLVVVDPDHVSSPKSLDLPHTRLAAYVALGEVQPSRPYTAAIPKSWLVGENKTWGSRLIDQSQPQWPQFFAERVIAPLWERGFRTFFLDTLDSYQLFAKTPGQRQAQEQGMVAVITTLKQRYPEAHLIFNRGFEILPQLHAQVEMVVAESLFQSFDADKKQYREVSAADRSWLLDQLMHAKNEYKLDVAAIDYVDPANRDLARSTARKILDLGVIPWVATPDLASLGVGAVEVMPRKVLVVHSTLNNEYALRLVDPLRLASAPLTYLGYVPEFVDLKHLPQDVLPGRYAGIVLWLSRDPGVGDLRPLTNWLGTQLGMHLPIAMINPPTALLAGRLSSTLGLKFGEASAAFAPIKIISQSPFVGFEVAPRADADGFFSLALAQGEPLLTLKQGQQTQVSVALTPWGGYALSGFSVITLPANVGDRWVVDPFAFFQKALHLPPMPVPDVTTESGRRMLMVHMDGDGFISRSELPSNPMAGQVVLDRVVKKYPLPMTISVIEAEVSPTGLYPSLSPTAEKIAQNIFRQPNVAIASHSYSHPFIWRKASASDVQEGYNLRLPGYRFDLEREITGSVNYIQNRLAPPGKKVEMFFWTGDCVPGNDALALTQKLGLLNLNGGDTVATASNPTITDVEGLGVPRPAGFQVFAPNQNENVYTNDWQGPYYGFERVTETFALTDKPRRLKPMDIYFHSYITTKAAGMASLDKVFAYALAQETTPVYVADYARKVLDFQQLAVAKTPLGWRIRGAKDLRELRLPEGAGWPDLAASQSVAGFTDAIGSAYVHLSADNAELALSPQKSDAPRLVSANARIDRFESGDQGLRWRLTAYVPLKFSLANVQGCRVSVSGRPVKPVRRVGDTSEFEIKDHVASPLEAICQR
jgi:uncharacterized protein (TIGR01370 family)